MNPTLELRMPSIQRSPDMPQLLRGFLFGIWILGVGLLEVGLLREPLRAQDDQDGPQPGFVATFQDEHGNRCERIDQTLSHVWGNEIPDPRISGESFEGMWKGDLLIRGQGEHHFHVYLEGECTIRLDGQVVLEATSVAPAWHSSKAVATKPGFHPIEIHFRKRSKSARMSIHWQGPGFRLEPIDSALMFHESRPEQTGSLKRGVIGSSRFDVLNAIPFHGHRSCATFAIGSFDRARVPSWIVSHLTDGKIVRDRAVPAMHLRSDEARALLAYLEDVASHAKQRVEISKPLPQEANTKSSSPPKTSSTKDSKKEKYLPTAVAGETHFLSKGCLACHRVGGLGSKDPTAGGDLSTVAQKRPSSFFAKWLTTPERLQPLHRMPVFDLSEDELADLQLYLSSLGKPLNLSAEAEKVQQGPDKEELVREGKRLYVARQCNACHEIGSDAREGGVKSTLHDGWRKNERLGCISNATSPTAGAANHPQFELEEPVRQSVLHYLETVQAIRKPRAPSVRGVDLIASHHCLNCHPRGIGKGIADEATLVSERLGAKIEHVATLVPPSLNSIGDKLHDHALREVVQGKSALRRPWLKVQMPKFRLGTSELDRIVQHWWRPIESQSKRYHRMSRWTICS